MQVDNYQNYKQMKVKLQSSNKLHLAKVVKEMTNLCLKETVDLIDEQNPPKENNGSHVKRSVVIDSEKTEEQIKAIARPYDVSYTIVDVCGPEKRRKLQEITDDELGVSIHSIDEESIGWQCKILFNHGQATRVLAGLHDAKFNVTEALVMHEGNKVTMLVITKTFPTGTRKKDLDKFEKLLRTFIYTVCKVVSLENELEVTKERAIEAFDELQDYE